MLWGWLSLVSERTPEQGACTSPGSGREERGGSSRPPSTLHNKRLVRVGGHMMDDRELFHSLIRCNLLCCGFCWLVCLSYNTSVSLSCSCRTDDWSTPPVNPFHSPLVLCRALFCPALSCPVLSGLVLSGLVLSCPVLSCPVLSCPVLSCPVLSCPVPVVYIYAFTRAKHSVIALPTRLTYFLRPLPVISL